MKYGPQLKHSNKQFTLDGRRRYFTRHPITGLNFNKTISKPYYSQAILFNNNLNKQYTLSNKIS
jgi:hypothetical protein